MWTWILVFFQIFINAFAHHFGNEIPAHFAVHQGHDVSVPVRVGIYGSDIQIVHLHCIFFWATRRQKVQIALSENEFVLHFLLGRTWIESIDCTIRELTSIASIARRAEQKVIALCSMFGTQRDIECQSHFQRVELYFVFLGHIEIGNIEWPPVRGTILCENY